MSRLKKKYTEETRKELQEKFSYKNPMLIPQLTKVVISMGIGEATKDKNIMTDHMEELTQLSGQKPIMCRTKKAVSNFKTREGQPIGLKVTLRGKRMYDFLDRFCNISSPRIRDFRGFPKKGDSRGNYTLGLEDQQIFPEVNLDKVKRNQGMHITFVTTANTDEECISLLSSLGVPFKKAGKN